MCSSKLSAQTRQRLINEVTEISVVTLKEILQ